MTLVSPVGQHSAVGTQPLLARARERVDAATGLHLRSGKMKKGAIFAARVTEKEPTVCE